MIKSILMGLIVYSMPISAQEDFKSYDLVGKVVKSITKDTNQVKERNFIALSCQERDQKNHCQSVQFIKFQGRLSNMTNISSLGKVISIDQYVSDFARRTYQLQTMPNDPYYETTYSLIFDGDFVIADAINCWVADCNAAWYIFIPPLGIPALIGAIADLSLYALTSPVEIGRLAVYGVKKLNYEVKAKKLKKLVDPKLLKQFKKGKRPGVVRVPESSFGSLESWIHNDF